MAGKTLVATACVFVGFGVAACGSDSTEESGSDGDFAAQADQICTDAQSEIVEIGQNLGPVTSDADVIPRIEKFIPVREQTLSDLEALDPPEESQSSFEEMIDLRRQSLELSEQELKLRKADDLEGAAKIAAKSKTLQEKANEAAEEVGLTACARILPDEDVEQAKEAVTTLETSNDPALCTDILTEEGQESLFGGLKECEKTQEGFKASELAESVTFEEVTGIEGVTAGVVGTVNGGELDGDHAQYELIYEDGTYKVNAVFAAP